MSHTKDLVMIYEELLVNKRKQFPLNTWSHPIENKSNLIKLVRYLVLEKLKWSRTDFCNNFCYNVIVKYRLNTGFMKVYSRNIFPLIIDAFPEWSVSAWELKKSRVPANFWSKENGIAATKWLVEERLGWTLDKVQSEISNSSFLKNNLGGMLRTLKIGGADAIVMAYPDQDWTYLIERAGYKLTQSQAEEIKRLYKSGVMNQRQLAFKYNVNPSNVHSIVHGKTYK